MYFKLPIAGKEAILTADQLTAIYELLQDARMFKNEYVGSGKGDDGGSYRDLVRRFPLDEIDVRLMSDALVGALELKTKIMDAEAKK
jgi:hypothetical protein